MSLNELCDQRDASGHLTTEAWKARALHWCSAYHKLQAENVKLQNVVNEASKKITDALAKFNNAKGPQA